MFVVNPELHEELKIRNKGAHIDQDQYKYLEGLFRKFQAYCRLIQSIYHLSNATCHRIRTNNLSYSKNKEQISQLKKNSDISSETKE